MTEGAGVRMMGVWLGPRVKHEDDGGVKHEDDGGCDCFMPLALILVSVFEQVRCSIHLLVHQMSL